MDGREAEELYRRQLDASAFLIDGALELCAYLKDRYDLYVVTNGTSSTQYKRLAASGLDGFMKDIFVSEDAGSQKPQKEYFDYCFSRIPDANPRRMLLIGDSPASDIKGGMAAGTYTCWYNPGGQTLPEGIRADYESFAGTCSALNFGEGDSGADLCQFCHIKCPLHKRFSVLI